MTILTKGSITIEIGNPKGEMREFVLDGTVGEQIQVGWRSKDNGGELPLGSLPDIIVSVYTAFGGNEDFYEVLKQRLEELKKIPPLVPVVELLTNNSVYVTDLGLTALYDPKAKEGKGSYVVAEAAFGFRVVFEPKVEVGPIGLKGFGVLFEYTPKAAGDSGVGRLTTRTVAPDAGRRRRRRA